MKCAGPIATDGSTDSSTDKAQMGLIEATPVEYNRVGGRRKGVRGEKDMAVSWLILFCCLLYELLVSLCLGNTI